MQNYDPLKINVRAYLGIASVGYETSIAYYLEITIAYYLRITAADYEEIPAEDFVLQKNCFNLKSPT